MSNWMIRAMAVMRDERAQAYVEYVVLGAVAVLVILAAIQFFFGSIAALFQRMAQALFELG